MTCAYSFVIVYLIVANNLVPPVGVWCDHVGDDDHGSAAVRRGRPVRDDRLPAGGLPDCKAT